MKKILEYESSNDIHPEACKQRSEEQLHLFANKQRVKAHFRFWD